MDTLKDFKIIGRYGVTDKPSNETETRLLKLMCESAADGIAMQSAREY